MSDIKEALAKIAERDGELRPRVVVDEARDPNSPLHAEFCWDDNEAAEKYRLVQAGQLIRRVWVTVTRDSSFDRPVREYVKVTSPTSSGDSYQPVVKVLSDEQLRAELLSKFFNKIAALQREFGHLNELASIFKAAEKAAKKAA